MCRSGVGFSLASPFVEDTVVSRRNESTTFLRVGSGQVVFFLSVSEADFFPQGRRMRPGFVPVPVTSLHFHRQIIFATVPVVPTVPFETYPRRSCVFHPSSNGVLKPCRDLCSSKKEQQTCACAVEIQQLACANCKSGPVSLFAPTPGAGALLRTHQSRFAKQCCWIGTPSFGRFGWENNARHGLLFPPGSLHVSVL